MVVKVKGLMRIAPVRLAHTCISRIEPLVQQSTWHLLLLLLFVGCVLAEGLGLRDVINLISYLRLALFTMQCQLDKHRLLTHGYAISAISLWLLNCRSRYREAYRNKHGV